MTSGLSIDAVKIIQDAPGIARASNAPLLTPEAVLMAPIPLRSTGTDANVELSWCLAERLCHSPQYHNK